MPIAEQRAFRVHARHVDSHHAQIVKETSFEAAAVAYLEDFAQAPDEDHEVSVIVREIETGHEHCFRVDLQSGETSACSSNAG